MRLIEFAQDVLRFAKHGLLHRFCWLLFGRIEVLVCACVIAAMFEYASLPQTKIMVGFLAVFVAGWLFVMFTIQFLTPLYFGSFAVGRLKTRARPFILIGSIYDEFILVPSGRMVSVTYYGKRVITGMLGRSYLLLQHPSDEEAALAIIDDDPKYMNHIMGYVSQQRAAEIMHELNSLRSA
jgi:hypothetical protein